MAAGQNTFFRNCESTFTRPKVYFRVFFSTIKKGTTEIKTKSSQRILYVSELTRLIRSVLVKVNPLYLNYD